MKKFKFILPLALIIIFISQYSSHAATASYYASSFEGRKTASGEIYHGSVHSCATPSFNGKIYTIRIKNLSNGKTSHCRVNDRMGNSNRTLDVSHVVAIELGMLKSGVARIVIY